jgi:hypothetical protein
VRRPSKKAEDGGTSWNYYLKINAEEGERIILTYSQQADNLKI